MSDAELIARDGVAAAQFTGHCDRCGTFITLGTPVALAVDGRICGACIRHNTDQMLY